MAQPEYRQMDLSTTAINGQRRGKLGGRERGGMSKCCKGCERNWIAIHKDGYCKECYEAMREDHELSRREERMLEEDGE